MSPICEHMAALWKESVLPILNQPYVNLEQSLYVKGVQEALKADDAFHKKWGFPGELHSWGVRYIGENQSLNEELTRLDILFKKNTSSNAFTIDVE